jgi:hypothetical protein
VNNRSFIALACIAFAACGTGYIPPLRHEVNRNLDPHDKGSWQFESRAADAPRARLATLRHTGHGGTIVVDAIAAGDGSRLDFLIALRERIESRAVVASGFEDSGPHAIMIRWSDDPTGKDADKACGAVITMPSSDPQRILMCTGSWPVRAAARFDEHAPLNEQEMALQQACATIASLRSY